VKNIFILEKLIRRLPVNPGLALTAFRTTQPCILTTWGASHLVKNYGNFGSKKNGNGKRFFNSLHWKIPGLKRLLQRKDRFPG